MVAIEQNMLYIIIAVIVIVILVLVVFMRRRGSKGSLNVNQYLTREAELKKIQIVEREEGFKTKIPPYLKRPQDELDDIREATSELLHKNAYDNSKVEDKVDRLKSLEKEINLQNQLKIIHKKGLELNRKVKPKKGK